MYLTTSNRAFDLTKKATNFSTKDNMSPTCVTLAPTTRYQTIDGFGAAITGSTSYNLLLMQVVPGQRMVSDFDGEALQVYRALRHLNPSPYLFLVQGQTLTDQKPFHIVGSSPEILSRLENGIATVRPLAGTRPRGKTKEEDLALEQDLLADEKEIAEHLMLIDLGRNDVGRVSKIGKVQVTDRMVIERYSHVMHIVSNVQGEVRDDVDALDVFKATFPAGTLSGAPKIRAMEIIDEVEQFRVSYIKMDAAGMQENASDEEIQSWYDQHQDQFTQPQRNRYSVIQTKTEADAKAVLAELQKGADFATLAKQVTQRHVGFERLLIDL
jgi:hypothetical protein